MEETIYFDDLIDAANEMKVVDNIVREAAFEASKVQAKFEQLRKTMLRQTWEQIKGYIEVFIQVWRYDPRL